MKTLEAEFRVNPQSTKMPLIAKALGVTLPSVKVCIILLNFQITSNISKSKFLEELKNDSLRNIKKNPSFVFQNWFQNRRAKAKREEVQQKKRLEQFTCRVCGQECFSESRYVNHYQMVHNTRVIISSFQNKETGETRTKADYVIKTSNKDFVAALQASGCNISGQNESSVVDKSDSVQTEKESTSEQSDKSDQKEKEQSPKKATKDTEKNVVIVVSPGSLTQQQSDSSLAENEKGSHEANEIYEKDDTQNQSDGDGCAEVNDEIATDRKETGKETDDGGNSEAVENADIMTNKEEVQVPTQNENSIANQMQSQNTDSQKEDSAPMKEVEKVTENVDKVHEDKRSTEKKDPTSIKLTDVNDNREVPVEKRVNGKEMGSTERPTQQKDRLAKLYEQLSLKRKQKQQQLQKQK